MSNINNQTQDLYSIELVQDLNHEAAATVSGGALILSSDRGGDGRRITLNRGDRNLGNFNNRASWYSVTGNRDWFVYTDRGFQGDRRRLRAGVANNLPSNFNNDIESARPA